MHLVVEALRRGFQDRARYLGDPGFRASARLARARALTPTGARRRIDPPTATRSEQLAALQRKATTPLISRWWIATAIAWPPRLSINLPFGAGVMAGRHRGDPER